MTATPTLDALEALEGFPNLAAIISGTISGNVTEWPLVRVELAQLARRFSDTAFKWVRCSERLPSDDQHGNAFITFSSLWEEEVRQFEVRGTYSGFCWRDVEGEHVTHWMPLPEAPK